MLTLSGTGSVFMGGPDTLKARWLSLDYIIPIALVSLLGTTIFEIRRIGMRRRKTSELPIQEYGEPSITSTEPMQPTASSLLPKYQPEPALTQCRYCGAKMPLGSRRCTECGLSVRYLGPD